MIVTHEQWESIKTVAQGLGGAATIVKAISALSKTSAKHKALVRDNAALRKRVAELERGQREYKASLARSRMAQIQDDDSEEEFENVIRLSELKP